MPRSEGIRLTGGFGLVAFGQEGQELRGEDVGGDGGTGRTGAATIVLG